MVSGGWAVGVLLGLGAWAAHDVFAAEPAGAPAGQPGGNVEVETLVQKLPETSAIGYGYSALFSGSQFLPYPDSAKVHTLVLGSERPEKSTLLEAIVRHGADAIPVLVEHLDDDRKTKIPPLQGTEWISYADEYDYNRRTQKTPPSDVNREIFAEKGPASHTPTVGDLCFVALGQIVNRRFNATRYQPSGGLVVSSPTYSTRLRSVVRADYADFTADKHRQMLIQDFKGPDFEDRRIGAYLRLTLYYPEEVERLVIEQLRAPTYDPAIIREFLHKKLYAEKSLAGRKALFDAFVKANGPVSRDAIQLVLFEDLERQEAVERGRDAPPRLYDLDARSALMQLYAHGKNVTSRDVPNLNAWQVYVRARFIGSLTHDKSARIGDVVKGLFLESTGDDYFAPACLRCLASRGYGKFLTEQLNKIDVSRREDDALHEKYIAAVTVSEAPEVRDRLLEIVKTTPNVGFFMAALPAVEPKHDEAVLRSALRILAALPADTDQGKDLLTMIGKRFPAQAKSIYRSFLSTGSVRRAGTMCEVLWYGNPMAKEVLAPLLDDKRLLPAYPRPMRVCDRAATAISQASRQIRFDSDWSTTERDQAIERLKQYCKEAASSANKSPDGPSQ
jgi:hypothetical protein